MKRVLFALLTSTAMLIAVPVSALARPHHRGHHRSHVHHVRVHRQHFGSDSQAPVGAVGQQQNAGTVSSFSGSILTVVLNDGSIVRGNVTAATRLECQSTGTATQPGDEQATIADNGDRGDDNVSRGGDNGDRDDDQGVDQKMCTTSALTPGPSSTRRSSSSPAPGRPGATSS